MSNTHNPTSPAIQHRTIQWKVSRLKLVYLETALLDAIAYNEELRIRLPTMQDAVDHIIRTDKELLKDIRDALLISLL